MVAIFLVIIQRKSSARFLAENVKLVPVMILQKTLHRRLTGGQVHQLISSDKIHDPQKSCCYVWQTIRTELDRCVIGLPQSLIGRVVKPHHSLTRPIPTSIKTNGKFFDFIHDEPRLGEGMPSNAFLSLAAGCAIHWLKNIH